MVFRPSRWYLQGTRGISRLPNARTATGPHHPCIEPPSRSCVDPFGGSGTTLCVAKKLGRRWMGFELSEDYVQYISQRLDKTAIGDPVDGPADPIESAPSTAAGKQRKKPFGEKTEQAVVEAYGEFGYPADYLLCDKSLNAEFIARCLKKGIGGNAYVWNRYLLALRKAGKLSAAKRPEQLTAEKLNQFGFASEVAWRLMAIDYQKTLDDILCSPDFAKEFDRLASEFGPSDIDVSSLEYRLAALSIRKRCHDSRATAILEFSQWTTRERRLPEIDLDGSLKELEQSGVFVLSDDGTGVFAEASENMRLQVERMLSNENWARSSARLGKVCATRRQPREQICVEGRVGNAGATASKLPAAYSGLGTPPHGNRLVRAAHADLPTIKHEWMPNPLACAPCLSSTFAIFLECGNLLPLWLILSNLHTWELC